METKVINGRWSVDGVKVQHADFLSVTVFVVWFHIKRLSAPLPIFNTLKLRPSVIKSRYNYKFPEHILTNARISKYAVLHPETL